MNYQKIPYETALAAYRNISMTPEKRAADCVAEYDRFMQFDYAEFSGLATTDELKQVLADNWPRYEQGVYKRETALLNAMSRCASSMVTGPAKFPVRQNKKRQEIEIKRLQESVEYREKAKAAIRKKLIPGAEIIKSGDDDAIEKLQAKIESFELRQVYMKRVNRIIRKFTKDGVGRQLKALLDAGIKEAIAKQALIPDYMGRLGFPSYEITNNGANIRSMKKRLEIIKSAKEKPETLCISNGVTIKDCPADNRVRLYFPDKPAKEIREKLKANNFRWAPSLGCWQAYRNPRSMEFVKTFS